MKSALEYVTNAAILVVCVLLLAFFVRHRGVLLGKEAVQVADDGLKGTMLTSLPEYRWSEHDKTLLLALKVGCQFCDASMPFYKRLSELQQAHRIHPYLLAFMPDQNAPAIEMLQSHGIDISCACGHPLGLIHVSGTPTLLLINAQGRIEHAWVGQLAPAEESAVIAELEK